MHPLLFEIANFKIWSYGFFYLLALILSFLLFIIRGKKQGYNLDLLINLILFEYLMALIGCRLLFVFLYPAYYRNFSEILQLQKGGFAYYGGLLFALISGAMYLYLKKQNVLAIFDILMPLTFLGNFLGRIGCFLKGCCWGIVCNIRQLCVIFPKDSDAYNSHLSYNLITKDSAYSLPVYPIQLYESLLCGILFVYFWTKYKNRRYDGQIMFESILAYAIERFFVDFLRGDVSKTYFFSISQHISIGLAIISLWFLLSKRK